jgi:SHS2 domain-containing protein
MWAYMTDLRGIAVDPSVTRVIEVDGIDLCSLLFGWLDGCLAAYGMDYFIGRSIAVTHWGQDADGAPGAVGRWRIRAIVRGALFVFGEHAQGTEVKAITYSNMQIFCADGTVVSANDAIDAAAAAALEDGGGAAHATIEADGGGGAAAAVEGGAERAGERKGVVDVYVIVDI